MDSWIVSIAVCPARVADLRLEGRTADLDRTRERMPECIVRLPPDEGLPHRGVVSACPLQVKEEFRHAAWHTMLSWYIIKPCRISSREVPSTVPRGVMVAQVVLVHLVQVRILAG